MGLQRTTLVARVAAAGGDHPIRGDREDLFWGVSLNGDSPIFFEFYWKMPLKWMI